MAAKISRIPTEWDGVNIPAHGPHYFPDRVGRRMLWERDERRRSVRGAAVRAAQYAHMAIFVGDETAEGLLAEALGLVL